MTSFAREITEIRDNYVSEHGDPHKREMHHQLQAILQKHHQKPMLPQAQRAPVTRAPKKPQAPDILWPPANGLPRKPGQVPALQAQQPQPGAESESLKLDKDGKEKAANREFHLRFCKWQLQQQKANQEGRGGSRRGDETPRAGGTPRTPRQGASQLPVPIPSSLVRDTPAGAGGGNPEEQLLDGEKAIPTVTGPQPRYVEHLFAKDVWQLANASTVRVRYCAGGGSSRGADFFKKPNCTFIDQQPESYADLNASSSINLTSKSRLAMSVDLSLVRAALGTNDMDGVEEGGNQPVGHASSRPRPPAKAATARHKKASQPHRPWFMTEAGLSEKETPLSAREATRENSVTATSSSTLPTLSGGPGSVLTIKRPPVPTPWTCKVALHEVREIESIAELRRRVCRPTGHGGEDLSRLIPDPSPEMEVVAKAIASSNSDFRRMVAYRSQDTEQRLQDAAQKHRQTKHRGGLDQHKQFECMVNEDRRQLFRNGADEIHRWMEDRTRLYDMKFDRMDLSQGTISWQRTLTRIRETISCALEEEFSTERREIQDEFIVKFRKAFEKRFPVLSDEATRLLRIVEEMFHANAPFGAREIAAVTDSLPLDYFILPDVISLIFSLAMNLSIDDQYWLKHIRQRTQFLDEKKQRVTPPLPDTDEERASASWVLKLQPSQQNSAILRWALGKAAASTLTKDELTAILRNANLSVLIQTVISMAPTEVHPDVVDGIQVMINFQPWSKEIPKLADAPALTQWMKKCTAVSAVTTNTRAVVRN